MYVHTRLSFICDLLLQNAECRSKTAASYTRLINSNRKQSAKVVLPTVNKWRIAIADNFTNRLYSAVKKKKRVTCAPECINGATIHLQTSKFNLFYAIDTAIIIEIMLHFHINDINSELKLLVFFYHFQKRFKIVMIVNNVFVKRCFSKNEYQHKHICFFFII